MTDAPYRTDLSSAVLQLQENGVIGELQNKWWKQKRGGDMCDVCSIYVLMLYCDVKIIHTTSNSAQSSKYVLQMHSAVEF